jgi:hypothetical protein
VGPGIAKHCHKCFKILHPLSHCCALLLLHLQGSKLVVYGCLSGKAPTWPWQAWVFKGLQVSGFNLRKALAADTPAGAAKLRKNLAALGQLVKVGLLSLEFTEYGCAEEWQDALEHVIDAPGGSRVLLRM